MPSQIQPSIRQGAASPSSPRPSSPLPPSPLNNAIINNVPSVPDPDVELSPRQPCALLNSPEYSPLGMRSSSPELIMLIIPFITAKTMS
ncbi:hypothetical protein C8J56DRAFT_1040031 [Mycena floridula]|nr:hypothetical protein C8J56DRAFT_1040031 [Mycena floridula]